MKVWRKDDGCLMSGVGCWVTGFIPYLTSVATVFSQRPFHSKIERAFS